MRHREKARRTLYRFDNLTTKRVFFPSPERAVKTPAGMARYRCWVKARSH